MTILNKIIAQCENSENTEDNNHSINDNRKQEIVHPLCYVLENITKPIFNINEYMPYYCDSFMHDICIFVRYGISRNFYKLERRINAINKSIAQQNIPN